MNRKLGSEQINAATQENEETSRLSPCFPASTGEFWGKVVVNGQKVFFRAFTLPNGTINVGTYTVGAP
jgi:hypothetical protein